MSRCGARRRASCAISVRGPAIERHAVDNGVLVGRIEHQRAARAARHDDVVGHPVAVDRPSGLDAPGRGVVMRCHRATARGMIVGSKTMCRKPGAS